MQKASKALAKDAKHYAKEAKETKSPNKKKHEKIGISIRCKSYKGVAEEAPGAYKDVTQVVLSTQASHLATLVARVKPLVCVKG